MAVAAGAGTWVARAENKRLRGRARCDRPGSPRCVFILGAQGNQGNALGRAEGLRVWCGGGGLKRFAWLKLTHLPAGLTEAGQNGRADVRPLHHTLVPQPGKNCGLGLCLRAFYK